MQTTHRATTVHYLYITDAAGIGQVFPAVKNYLVKNTSTHVSLLYASETSSPVFTPELAILAHHFPSQFMLFLVHDQQNPYERQETLEAILNADTCDRLVVDVLGQEDFVTTVLDQLWFLGLKKDDIQHRFLR